MLRTSKNTSIYIDFGRNRQIETIDGYDGMVHRGLFQLSYRRWILMDGPNEAWWDAL